MDDAERDDALSFLREGWKDAAVFAVSAKTGAGVADFADYILAHTSRLLHPDLAYGGSDFCAAMGKMAQYGRQFYVEVCCNTFDGNAYLRDLAEAIRKNICAAGGHTPHLKLFAMGPDGSYGKLSAVGSSGGLTLDHALDAPGDGAAGRHQHQRCLSLRCAQPRDGRGDRRNGAAIPACRDDLYDRML